MQVIKDWDSSLYEAHLVPAAHVHFHSGSHPPADGPPLRPEVLALKSDPPAKVVAHSNSGRGAQSVGGGTRISEPGSVPRGAGPAPSNGAPETRGKTPKWMRVGK